MDKSDSQLIWESYAEGGFIKMYHGGSKWRHFDAKIIPPKKGRFESGIGINLTTHYLTARKYAKGSNIVSIVLLDPNLKLSDDVDIPVKDIIDFSKRFIGPSKRREFIEIIERSAERMNKEALPALYLVNLSVNLEIGGKQGLALIDFIVEHGVDASLNKQSNNEEWLVVHNPKIIKRVIHTKPSDISLDDYELPSIEKQIK